MGCYYRLFWDGGFDAGKRVGLRNSGVEVVVVWSQRDGGDADFGCAWKLLMAQLVLSADSRWRD